jgi:chemotaxis methyl-accepting protein methylase
MKKELDRIIRVIQQLSGTDISMFDNSFLSRSLEKRLSVTQCVSIDRYLDFLVINPEEARFLCSSLIIQFSEFFRNPLTFSLLEQVVLPRLIQKKITTRQKEIRIWSAACSAGQEAYSLAIIFEELLARSDDKLSYRIFATDLIEARLDEARRGQFTEASLGQVSMKRLTRWFEKRGDMYHIQPVLRDHIDCSVFDLLNSERFSPPASIFGDFDLIFCANLFFYYKTEYRELMIRKIGNCLAPKGHLVTGDTERDILMNHNYQEICQQSAIFQV